ncbi:response regulator [Streptomyces naphthomycinicus]|uniref:response regulator n=1 Tax=Streptomyces naphthomycinicus TaxID=2872625 RepID=UPI001CEC3C67|nr:response regulator transcription factor [Streptomyces sp. TML10]
MIDGATETVTIVVADDHSLFREGLKELLATVPEFSVVGTAGDGDQALSLVRQYRPDILLLDVQMPGPAAAVVVERTCRLSPTTRAVALAMHDDTALMEELLLRGAAAYLVKNMARDELVAALITVVHSSGNVLVSVPQGAIRALGRRSDVEEPSPRELDILRLVALGMSNRQIATRLHLAEATVKRHLTNVYAKLGAVSRVDAVRRAGTLGLIDLS